MKISKLLTDDAILAEIGERVARRRLDLQLIQAEMAEQLVALDGRRLARGKIGWRFASRAGTE